VSSKQEGADAEDVGEDGGWVFGELKVDGIGRVGAGAGAGTGVGDQDGAVVVGLDGNGDLAAAPEAAVPVLAAAVVTAEVCAIDGGLAAPVVPVLDVPAELNHGWIPPPPGTV